jgi:hypothetical protein
MTQTVEKKRDLTSADQSRHEAYISYDAKSFTIGEKRVFLNIASIHYFRMPKQEWREVLVKAKLAGMNCIDTYFAWNVHEPQEGQWNFEGDNDCGAFLDLCAELGLWVIARPGPFICAEWDFGGFPYWLKTKENIRFRINDEVYLHYVNRYFDQIGAIISARQITKGGSVILVQVENEYGYLADDASGKLYMNSLRDGLLDRGIDVPLITCEGGAEGTIEGANFWSGANGHYEKLMLKQPDAPKIVTEFWTGWFEHWGAPSATQKTPELYEKRMMEIIRAGFDGISHYMFFGGTNFGGYGGRTVGSSDIFMVTSYDYDAPLSEYGRVTPKYRMSKKISLFATALGQLLLESEPIENGEARSGSGLRLQGREWNGQKIWFAESLKEEKEGFSITLEKGRTIPVSIRPGQIVPVIDRLEVGSGLQLTCGGFLIGNDIIGGVRTLILAGEDGQRSHIQFESDQSIQYSSDGIVLAESSAEGRSLTLDVFHFQTPQRITIKSGGEQVEVIVLNGYMSDRAWRIAGESIAWAIGWDDLDLNGQGGVDGVSGRPDGDKLLLGDWGGKESGTLAADLALYEHPPIQAPVLSDWKTKSLNLKELKAGEISPQPRGFAELDREFGYLIYSSEVNVPQEQESTLVFSAVQDSTRIYVNGVEQAMVRQVGAAYATIKLPQGRSKLQLLVQHMGSLNFSPYLGEEKGVFGPVYLDGAALDLRSGWLCNGESFDLDEVQDGSFSVPLTRTFELDGNEGAILVGAIASGLKINGKEVHLEAYHNWFAFHYVDISDYVAEGVNKIEMPGFKTPMNRLDLLTYSKQKEVTGWSILPLEEPSASPAALEKATVEAAPTWFSTTFDMPAIPKSIHPKLKLRLTGMSKGYVLLNGHDLGRYWQIGPQEDYKLPMDWLKESGNELTLFDEQGKKPSHVRLLFDDQSDWRWSAL